jgi:hypothetical protein
MAFAPIDQSLSYVMRGLHRRNAAALFASAGGQS